MSDVCMVFSCIFRRLRIRARRHSRLQIRNLFSQDQMKFSCDSHKTQREIQDVSKVNRNARDKILSSRLIWVGGEKEERKHCIEEQKKCSVNRLFLSSCFFTRGRTFDFFFFFPYPLQVHFLRWYFSVCLLTCHSDCQGLFSNITVNVPLKEKLIFLIEAWSI